jgi:hypothetical protein
VEHPGGRGVHGRFSRADPVSRGGAGAGAGVVGEGPTTRLGLGPNSEAACAACFSTAASSTSAGYRAVFEFCYDFSIANGSDDRAHVREVVKEIVGNRLTYSGKLFPWACKPMKTPQTGSSGAS